MVDISGGDKSQVVFKDGLFYAWNGSAWTEIKLVNKNLGVANTGVTAVEYGGAYRHQTILTINQAAALTSGDNASLADGYLIYTFPAGEIVVHAASMQLALVNAEHAAETVEVGIGTTIGTGAVAVLGGTAGMENILTGTAAAGMEATDILTLTAIPTAAVPLVIADADPHIVHVNMALGWANTAGAALDVDLAGTVILDWSYMGNPA